MENGSRKDLTKLQGYKLLGGVHPSVLAIWAALIAAGNLLPAIPIIGSGGTFSVSAALIPLAGVFFGPIGGAICGAIGGFIGQIIAPHIAWLGIATFLIGTVNAFVAGCITRRKWYIAVGIIALGYILWFSTAIGRGAAVFPLVFYTIGLVATGVGAVIWRNEHIFSKKPVLRSIGVFAAAYGGFVGAAALANFAGIMLYQWPSQMWVGLTFVSPWERAIFSLGATIIGVPLLLGLPKIGVFIGSDLEEEDEGDDEAEERKED
jgi:uncharacterized membrane protein